MPIQISPPLFKTGSRQRFLAMLSGTSLSMLILLGSFPIITRYFSPEEFGRHGMFLAYCGVWATFASLRLELFFSLAEDQTAARGLFPVSCASSVLFAAIGAGVWMWLAAGQSWQVPGGLIFGGILLPALVQILTYVAIAEDRFPRLALSKIVFASGQILSQILLKREGFDHGLQLGTLAGNLVAAACLLGVLGKDHLSLSRALVPFLTRCRRKIAANVGSVLVNQAGLALPGMLMTVLFGDASGGCFALAQRVASLPVLIISGTVAPIFLSQASTKFRQSPHHATEYYRRTRRRLVGTGIFSAFVLLLVTQHFGPIFGETWLEARGYLIYFAGIVTLQIIVSPISSILLVVGRPDIQLFWDILRLLAVSLAVILAAHLSGRPEIAVQAFTIAGLTMYAALLGLHTHQLQRANARGTTNGHP